jgi:2-succinyl-6-hydroxy-2,4-cyclohexadiene-1-carboxylate synthase
MEARRARAESDKLRAEQIRERGFVQFLDEWYCLPVFASLRAKPGIYQSMIERRRKEHPEWAARSLEMLSPGLQPNNSERLFALEMPALFVAGAMDLKFSILAQDMSKRVANGEFIQLDDAGHNVHLEKPFEFAKTVADFLMTRMSDCI